MQRNSHATLSAGDVFRRAGADFCCSAPVRCLLIFTALIFVIIWAVPVAFADATSSAVVPFHIVRGFAVIVPVTVDGHGPYDFMLDTGSTITSVDRELGQELALASQGGGTVMTLTEHTPASLAVARRVVFGPVTEQNVEVMIRDLNGLRQMVPTARGVLGQNALNHADFLLDYKHKFVEFDVDGELVRLLKGHHVPLRKNVVGDNPHYANLTVNARITDNGARAMDLMLDSGAASMVLFGGIERDGMDNAEGFVADTGGRQLLANVRNIQLVIDGESRELATNVLAFKEVGKDIGGLLPTAIFDRIYISNSGGFAMFDPKVKKPGATDRMIAGLTPPARTGATAAIR